MVASDVDAGIEAYRSRDFARAEAELRAALKSHPDSHRARLYLVRTLIAEDQLPKALDEIRPLLGSRDPDQQFTAGRLLEELAARRAAELGRVAPNSAESHYLLGRSLESAGKLQEAEQQYQQAAQKSPPMAGVHFALGRLARRQNDLEAARAEFTKELALNANHAGANLAMGQIFIAQNLAANAIPYLTSAVHDEPAMLEAHRELGRAFRAESRYKEALEEFRIVAERKPQDEQIHAQLASIYRALGRVPEAAREADIHRKILERKLSASQAVARDAN
jgi:tetratricopeptide (TPR) repeat protein